MGNPDLPGEVLFIGPVEGGRVGLCPLEDEVDGPGPVLLARRRVTARGSGSNFQDFPGQKNISNSFLIPPYIFLLLICMNE